MLEDGYCSPTPCRHATTEQCHPPSQEWAGLHVAPLLCLSCRRPWGAACVGGSDAQHAHRCAGWHLAAGTSLLHTSSLQGWDLPWGFRSPREFLWSTTAFVKCPWERIPGPERLCPREEWHTSSTTLFQAAPGAAGTSPGRPLLQRVWTACRRWGPRLLGAGQSSFPSPQVGPAPELLHGGTLHPLLLAPTTAAASQEGTSASIPEPPSRPAQQLTSINSSKPPHQVCAGAERPACATHHVPLQKGWFQLGGGGSGSGNCTPSQQLQGWELVWHPRKWSHYIVGTSGPQHPRLWYVG